MGRLSGLPLDLWPTDSVYHSTERGRRERRGGWWKDTKEQSDLKPHLHRDLLKLTGTTSGKHSLNYDTADILNTFAGQIGATGDVC